MTTENEIDLKAGRRRVARSRGALSGVLLIVLGLMAALLPFIGPYFNLAFAPRPNDAWYWTAGRFWYEVLPGAGAALGGILLLLSASRAITLFGAWLAAVSGAWLVVGPSLSEVLNLSTGSPDPDLRPGFAALAALLFFYATGAAIVLIAGIALGRLSVHSVRDVRDAERRAEVERAAEEQRFEHERRAQEDRDRFEREQAERAQTQRAEHEEAERAHAERERAERDQAERAHADRDQAERERAEHEQAEQAQAERARSEHGQAVQAHAEQENAQHAQPQPQPEQAQAQRSQPEPTSGGWPPQPQAQPQPQGGNQVGNQGPPPQPMQQPTYPVAPPPPPPEQR